MLSVAIGLHDFTPESTSDSIPETPVMLTSRATSRTFVTKTSSKLDQNSSRSCRSVTDPITIGDDDSSDDSEPEIVPLCKRIGVVSDKSLTPSQAARDSALRRLTPSQAAGAAAIRRLGAIERNRKCVKTSIVTAVGVQATNFEETSAKTLSDTANRESGGATRELWQLGPSTSGGISNCSGRQESSYQSTTADRHVDLDSPQFVLRPGDHTRYSVYVVFDIMHFIVHVLLRR